MQLLELELHAGMQQNDSDLYRLGLNTNLLYLQQRVVGNAGLNLDKESKNKPLMAFTGENL